MHPRGGRVWGERLLAPRRQEMGEQGKDQDQASHSETLLLPMRKKLLEPHKISLSAKEQCGSPWGTFPIRTITIVELWYPYHKQTTRSVWPFLLTGALALCFITSSAGTE